MTADVEPASAGPLAHLAHLARQTVPPMNPAGRPFVAGSAIATLVLRSVWRPLGLPGGLITAWCAWFFREPRRVTPRRQGIVVSAADGTVATVGQALPPAELDLGGEPMLRVSVFLSIFDVHVQRAPVEGEIRRIHYRPGKFLSADLDKASEDNERNSMVLRTPAGQDIVVVQIAGLVARRIVCTVAEGEKIEAGATYGLIRFGSRVDTYVPLDSRVLVEPGQRTIGGETVLAELPAPAEPEPPAKPKPARRTRSTAAKTTATTADAAKTEPAQAQKTRKTTPKTPPKTPPKTNPKPNRKQSDDGGA